MRVRKIQAIIAAAVDEAQEMIDAEYSKLHLPPPEDHPLAQLGLRDGKDKVLEYLAHGEEGVALEHLAYMIHETDIPISEDTRQQILEVAQAMGMDVIL